MRGREWEGEAQLEVFNSNAVFISSVFYCSVQVEEKIDDVLGRDDEEASPSVSIAICSLDFFDINATRIALQNTFVFC